MVRSVNARIGKKLDELLKEVSEKHKMSIPEASDILAMEITGESLFLQKEKKKGKNVRRNMFG